MLSLKLLVLQLMLLGIHSVSVPSTNNKKATQSELISCHSCPTQQVITRYPNNTCLCPIHALRDEQYAIDSCYRYRQGLLTCKQSADPMYAAYFDDKTCQCKYQRALNCSQYVEPCNPPFSWYRGDNVTDCLCTATFECARCPAETIMENFHNGTCICRDLTEEEMSRIVRGRYRVNRDSPPTRITSRDLNRCSLYKKKLISCPEFPNTIVRSVFNSYTCSCEVLIADPCTDYVAPCLAPYFWYNEDDKMTCACVARKPCESCEPNLILEYGANDTCVCQRPRNEDYMETTTLSLLKNAPEKCRRWREGTYFCPLFESIEFTSYFNETTCECQTVSAVPCWMKAPKCEAPYHWYKDDNRLMCLCVHLTRCDDCLEDRIVERFNDGSCYCHHLSSVEN